MQLTIPKAPKTPTMTPILFGGGKKPKTFEVKKFLTISDMAHLLGIYFDKYIGKPEENEEGELVVPEPILDGFVFRALDAQIALDVNLLDVATNSNTESGQFSIDDIYGTEFLSIVKTNIKNWDVFIGILEDYKSVLKEDTFSLKTAISSAISSFANLDQKKIDEMVQAVKEVQENVSPAMKTLMEEGK